MNILLRKYSNELFAKLRHFLPVEREIVVLKVKDAIAFAVTLLDLREDIFRGAPAAFMAERLMDRAEGAAVRAAARSDEKAERFFFEKVMALRQVGKIGKGQGLDRKIFFPQVEGQRFSFFISQIRDPSQHPVFDFGAAKFNTGC